MNPFVYKVIGWGIGVVVLLILFAIQKYKENHDK